MYGMILYPVQCESLCRVPVFLPLTRSDRLVSKPGHVYPNFIDSETITQVDGAQSSRVPTPLHDDPCVAVRHAQLVDTDVELELEEAPLEAEESQPLGSRVPLTDEEFEASETSDTRTTSSHSSASSNSTTSLSPNHPLTQVSPTPTPTRASFYRRTARMTMRTQPTLSPGMLARILEATTLSPSSFHKRGTSELILETDSEGDELGEEDTEEDESSDADDNRESQGLNDEGQGLEDEGPGIEEDEAVPEGQQQAGSVIDTVVSVPLGLGYGAARHRVLESTKEIAHNLKDGRVYTDILTYVPLAALVQTPPSPEWSLGSLPVSPSSPVVPSPIASPVATLAATISVDKDQFIEGYDRDLGELYTMSGAARDEIFSQRYRFRSLEQEQERATKENHDLKMQLCKERRERLELAYRVARMERRQEKVKPRALNQVGFTLESLSGCWSGSYPDARPKLSLLFKSFPLDGLHFDDKLQFVEEPIEITDREVKRLKRSRIPLVKIRWNSKRGPEFTWEREDQFRKKYPHLFTKTAPSSSAV
ncbi:hypothetical protein Tco_0057616 [Tanacetum coccineum]